LHTGNGTGSNKFIDCNFYVNNVRLTRPIENIYTYVTNYGNSINYYGNTLLLKVLDEIGNEITDASVLLKDKNNNTVFSQLTDSSGNIQTQDVVWFTVELISMSVSGIENDNNCIRTNLNPFTLTISKQGYRDYNIIGDIDKKIDMVLTLEDYEPPPEYTNIF
jgi:hypothetical protein